MAPRLRAKPLPLACDFTLGAGLRCLTLSTDQDQPSCREEQASLLVSKDSTPSPPDSKLLRFLNATLQGLAQMTQTHCQEAGPAQQVTAHDKEMGSPASESVWEAIVSGWDQRWAVRWFEGAAASGGVQEEAGH